MAYIHPRACLRAHTLPVNHKEFEIYAQGVCGTHARGLINYFPSQPNQRSSETHFQTTFYHFAKQEFPPPPPQTSPEPVNFPYFNNFLETNHAPYPSAPPVPAPHRRTRPVVFSAGQSSCRPQNFRRALSTSCNLHSNAKGRLKIPCGIFQTAFHFGYRLSNQSSPTSIVFSL